jgi:hypothetical protein
MHQINSQHVAPKQTVVFIIAVDHQVSPIAEIKYLKELKSGLQRELSVVLLHPTS